MKVKSQSKAIALEQSDEISKDSEINKSREINSGFVRVRIPKRQEQTQTEKWRAKRESKPYTESESKS